jgi:hypothetical protein
MNLISTESYRSLCLSSYMVILLIISTLTWSCGESKEQAPPNLIDERKMTQLLIDVHTLESQINHIHVGSTDSSQVMYWAMLPELLKKHKVDTTTFNQSYRYYAKNIEQFKGMYKIVSDTLQAREKSATAGTSTSPPVPTGKPTVK